MAMSLLRLFVSCIVVLISSFVLYPESHVGLTHRLPRPGHDNAMRGHSPAVMCGDCEKVTWPGVSPRHVESHLNFELRYRVFRWFQPPDAECPEKTKRVFSKL